MKMKFYLLSLNHELLVIFLRFSVFPTSENWFYLVLKLGIALQFNIAMNLRWFIKTSPNIDNENSIKLFGNFL